MLGDTGNKRAVYILLECILVKVDFLITLGRIRSLLPPHVFNCAKFDCFCGKKVQRLNMDKITCPCFLPGCTGGCFINNINVETSRMDHT